jgi:hypothetical protein
MLMVIGRRGTTVTFLFRVTIIAGELEEHHAWYEGIDIPATKSCRSNQEWLDEAFPECLSGYWREAFNIDDEGDWQVYGKAQIVGSWSGWEIEEYDEDLHVLNFDKQPIPSYQK